MNKTFILLGCFLFCSGGLLSQNKNFTLEEMIDLVKSRSPSFKLAQTKKELSYYQFITHKSDRKPQISVYGNAPTYNKQYATVVQPDGTIQFLPVQQNLNNIGISLTQEIPFSGGQLSLNTGLNQFYDFQSKFRQYNGTPVFLSLNQPLFGFNELRWKNKIEPLKFEEAQREFVRESENIAQESTKYYFDVLDAQANIRIAQSNLLNDNYNYETEKKRINLGTTTEDKLLQLELQTLKSQQDLEKATYDYKIAELALKTFIGYKDSINLEFSLPENISRFSVQLDNAIRFAKLYRPEFVSFERKKREAQRDVAQAKSQNHEISLLASFGLNKASTQLSAVYKDPRSQQTFSIGINFPIIDWGRRKARYNTSIALQKLVEFNNDIDSANIIQEITIIVNNFQLLQNNISLSRKTDSVANLRFKIANDLYQIGKLTITEINIAQTTKDNARRSYILALRDYWDSYYLLRKLTLFDFEKQKALNESK